MNLKLRMFAGYALAVGAVAAGLGLYRGLSAWVGSDLPTFITFYPAVMVAALIGGLGPGLFATALATLAADCWIQEPRGELAVKSLHDGVALVLFCFMGGFISTVVHLYQRARGKAAAYDQEQALRDILREKEFLASLLEHATMPFAVGYPDGRIGQFNRAYAQLTGYTAAELRGLDWSVKLTPPEWREMERQKLEELDRTGEPVRYEKEYIRKDGSRVPIELLVHLARDAEGQPEYYYTFLTDLTERRRAEEQLRLLSVAVAAAGNGIVITDRQGTVHWANPAFSELTGYSLAEAVGQNPRVLKSGQHPPEFYRAMWETVLGGKVWRGELINKRKDGSLYYEEMTITPVRTGGRDITHFIAIQQDITGRKQAQEALQRSRDRQALLSRTVSALLVAPDPQTVVERLCNDVRTFLNCDVFFNYLLDRGASRLRFNACGGVAPELARKVEGLELGESICGCAARDGCRVVAERVPITPDPRTALVKALGVRAYAAHPLLGPNHEVLGTLSFGTRSRDTFAEEDLGLMKEVADHVAIAISRKQTEEQLHKLNAELEQRVADATAELGAAYRYARSLIEASLDPLVTISPDGLITDVNEATEGVTGVPRERLIGTSFCDYFTEPQRAEQGYHKVLADGLVRDYPLTIRHVSGRTTDVLYHATVFRNEAGAVQGVFAAARDVTALQQTNEQLRREIEVRRQTEQRLTEAELRYRTVADFTYDWEYWETPELRLNYCSPSCERLTGYSAPEFVADPGLLQQIVHPDDAGTWQKHREQAFATREPCAIQFRIRTKDGGVRWMEHVGQPVVGKDGVFLGIRASNRDVTDRKVEEMQTQQLREELAHVTRIITAGQLAASLAHELNQPLTAILCNAQTGGQLLAADPPNVTEVREVLEDIAHDSERAGGVIHRLRALFHKTGQDRSALQVNDIIQETLELLRSEFVLKGIAIQVHLEPTLPKVLGNRIELQQVVLNLVVNAMDAMSEREPGQRQLEITTGCEGPGEIRASVRDSGAGIQVQPISRLFEPFFTTKANGMGMGLAISQSILEAHGGSLGAVNNPDRGATFQLTLPIHHGEHA